MIKSDKNRFLWKKSDPNSYLGGPLASKMTAPQMCLFIFNFKHGTSIKITFLENFLLSNVEKYTALCTYTSE